MKNYIKIGAGLVASASLALAQSAPTSLDGFAATGKAYIATGTEVAILAAVLGLGWVGFRIVKKFTRGATST